MLGEEVIAAALIYRLLHHCHIVNNGGNSYRMRDHLLRPGADDASKEDTAWPLRALYSAHSLQRARPVSVVWTPSEPLERHPQIVCSFQLPLTS